MEGLKSFRERNQFSPSNKQAAVQQQLKLPDYYISTSTKKHL
jgi:hypothetical protein